MQGCLCFCKDTEFAVSFKEYSVYLCGMKRGSNLFTRFLFFFSVVQTIPTFAQEAVTPLDEVEVRGVRPDRAAVTNAFSGGNAQMADSAVLERMNDASLADYLSAGSPVFVKESGHGMMSTISLRGSAASQTAVNWNGLPINSLTMGQTDFSLLPLFLFDFVELSPGGESSVYGAGSIGGSVSLRDHSFLADSVGGRAHVSAGSYDTWFGGLKWHASNKHVGSKTALFLNTAENDFHFELEGYDGAKSVCQRNAQARSWGGLEELGWMIDKRQLLSAKIWFTQNERNIQPSMQNNYDSLRYESISDKNIRIVADYQFGGLKNNGLFSATLAYLEDKQTYEEDIIATRDILAKTEYEVRLLGARRLKIVSKFGGQSQYICPMVGAYEDGHNEWRNDLWANMFAYIGRNNKWSATAGIRQQWVTDVDAPLSPSIGLKYALLEKYSDSLHYCLRLKANLSRNFRIPTLNDRFWGSKDKRSIKPEDAFCAEGGVEALGAIPHFNTAVSLTAFRNKVDDWILWMPRGNVWKPVNVDEVEAKGLEMNVKAELDISRVKNVLSLGGVWSHTEVIRGFSEMMPFQGRQMALLPEQTFSGSWTGYWSGWSLMLLSKYVGDRATSDVFDKMDSYWLWNTCLSYGFLLCGQVWTDLQFTINNLFDAQYQTVPYKAMPGRHYKTTLKFSF